MLLVLGFIRERLNIGLGLSQIENMTTQQKIDEAIAWTIAISILGGIIYFILK